MKKIFELKDFDTFVKELYENRTQKKSDVASAVEKIKEKYGDNARDFIAAVQKTGVNKLKDFVVKYVKPEIDLTTTKDLNPDYDGILNGLVCWILLEMQLEKDK